MGPRFFIFRMKKPKTQRTVSSVLIFKMGIPGTR